MNLIFQDLTYIAPWLGEGSNSVVEHLLCRERIPGSVLGTSILKDGIAGDMKDPCYNLGELQVKVVTRYWLRWTTGLIQYKAAS